MDKNEIVFSEIKPIDHSDICKLKALSLYYDKIWIPSHSSIAPIKSSSISGKFPKYTDRKFGKTKLKSITKERYLGTRKAKAIKQDLRDFLIPAIEEDFISIYSVGSSYIDNVLLKEGLSDYKTHEIPDRSILRFENLAEKELDIDKLDKNYTSILPSSSISKETIMWHVNRILLESSYLQSGISPPADYLHLFEYKFNRAIREIPGYDIERTLEKLFSIPQFPRLEYFNFDDIKSLKKERCFNSFKEKVDEWRKKGRLMEDDFFNSYIQKEFVDILSSYTVKHLDVKFISYDEVSGLTSVLLGILNPILGSSFAITSPLTKYIITTRKNEFIMFYYKLKSLERRKL